MVPEKMRPWCRPAFFLLFIPLALGVSSSGVKISNDFHWKIDLPVLIDSTIYFLGSFQVITEMCIFFSLFFLLYAVLKRWTDLLNYILFCQQIFFFICILIMASVLMSRYHSLKTDEAILNNAMSGYGKNVTLTKMMDTTQRELKCCGVYGYADWKDVNETLPVNSLSYEFARKAEERVPITCTTIREVLNKTHVQLHTGGCLVPFFTFKEHIIYGLVFNMELLIFIEIILVLLTDGILADYMASAAVANAERKQKEDIPSFYTLVFPPMPFAGF